MNFATSNPLIILVDGRDRVVLKNLLEKCLVDIVGNILIQAAINCLITKGVLRVSPD